MNARNLLLAALALAAVACDPHGERAQLADLPNKRADVDYTYWLDLRYDPDGDNCGELDRSQLTATYNGAPMVLSENGGPELSRHGLVGCRWVEFALPSPLPPGPADIVLSDPSETIRISYPALGDPRAFVPDFDLDGGVSAGAQLAFTWTPATDELRTNAPNPDGGWADVTTASLLVPDGGAVPLAFALDGGALQLSLPADVRPGDYTLALDFFCWREKATRCEGLTCADRSRCELLQLPFTVR